MVAAQPSSFAVLIAVLALVALVIGCGGIFLTIMERREVRKAKSDALAAATRAALAESALADIRFRRSEATRRGNRTPRQPHARRCPTGFA